MKKLIFIILLLAVTVKAQTHSISPSFDSLQANTLKMLNLSTSGNVTTEKVKFIINMSIGEVCDAFPALEKVDTVVANRDSSGSALNSDFLRIKSVFRIDQYGDNAEQEIWTPINYIPYDSLAIIFDTKKKSADDQAKIEDLLTSYTWNRKLYFQPKNYTTTTDPDSFVVFYYARDAMLASGTDSTNIAPEYMEELLYYIMSWVMTLPDDYGASDFYLNRYDKSAVTPKPREVDLKR